LEVDATMGSENEKMMNIYYTLEWVPLKLQEQNLTDI